jgi:hypothetical protein
MIGIGYPRPGNAVCNTYIAWGGSNDTLPVAGKMILGPFQVQGVTIQQPGEQTPWEIQFTNVPSAAGYTLVVTDTGNAVATCINITVDPAMCQQQQPMP